MVIIQHQKVASLCQQDDVNAMRGPTWILPTSIWMKQTRSRLKNERLCIVGHRLGKLEATLLLLLPSS